MPDAYSNIVCDDGTPINKSFGISAFANHDEVDVVEVVKQMYGMIWAMGEQLLFKDCNMFPTRDEIMEVIDNARDDSERGSARGESGL